MYRGVELSKDVLPPCFQAASLVITSLPWTLTAIVDDTLPFTSAASVLALDWDKEGRVFTCFFQSLFLSGLFVLSNRHFLLVQHLDMALSAFPCLLNYSSDSSRETCDNED